jgi:hypothetical protein
MATEKIRVYNRITKEWVELNVNDNKLAVGVNDSGTEENLVIHNPLTKEDITIKTIGGSIQIL